MALVKGMPRREAWADAADPVAQPRQKRVRFEGIENADVSKEQDKKAATVREMPEDIYDAFIMECNLQQRVLLRYGTQELTSFDEKECLRQVSEPRYRWRLEENVDTEGLVDWTQGMLDGNQDLLSEMALLDASITGSEALPEGLEHRFCALHRIEFYVFYIYGPF